MQNHRCTGVDYIKKKLSYLPLEGWYEIDSGKVFNSLSATNKWRGTRRAHLLCFQSIQDEPIIRPLSQQGSQLRKTHLHGVCNSIKVTSLRDASEAFGIPISGQLFPAQIEEGWGPEVCGLVLGYDQIVLIDSICIIL
jgi:hypothetical protein